MIIALTKEENDLLSRADDRQAKDENKAADQFHAAIVQASQAYANGRVSAQREFQAAVVEVAELHACEARRIQQFEFDRLKGKLSLTIVQEMKPSA